jgi:hypothetical protein
MSKSTIFTEECPRSSRRYLEIWMRRRSTGSRTIPDSRGARAVGFQKRVKLSLTHDGSTTRQLSA